MAAQGVLKQGFLVKKVSVQHTLRRQNRIRRQPLRRRPYFLPAVGVVGRSRNRGCCGKALRSARRTVCSV